MTLVVSIVGAHFNNSSAAELSIGHKIPLIYVESDDDADPFYRRPSRILIETVSKCLTALNATQTFSNHLYSY